jgi:Ca2+-binding RTX toxin-like protein
VTLNPDKTFALDHVFANSGRYSLVVNVADNHGGSASRSLAVSISAVALESDPASPRQTILAIGGTPGGDLISLVGRGSRGILVLLNGSLSGPYRPTSRVEVYGQAGNDVIQIAGCITTPARVFGGDGNDTIIGGDEADAFFGENGNDTLLGGGGNDSLDGGAGNDLLDGSSGNDALQGGAGFLDVLLGGDGNDVLSDPDGVRSASGGNGNDDMTLAFAANWNLSGSPIVPSSAISGGNGDDTIRLTSSTPELQFDVFGDNGKDRIELYGTWSKARVFGGNGTDTVKNRGIGQLKLSEIEIVE